MHPDLLQALGLDHPLPPETLIRVALAARDMTVEDLARRTGYHKTYLAEVLSRGRKISPRLAEKLAQALGGSAGFWLDMQAPWLDQATAKPPRQAGNTSPRFSLTLKVTAEEKQQIEDWAASQGVNRSQWIRQSCGLAASDYPARARNQDTLLIHAKITADERAYCQGKAQAAGMPMMWWVRQCCGLEPRPKAAIYYMPDASRLHLVELGQLGA